MDDAVAHQFLVLVIEAEARFPGEGAVEGIGAYAVHIGIAVLLIDPHVGEGEIIGVIVGILVEDRDAVAVRMEILPLDGVHAYRNRFPGGHGGDDGRGRGLLGLGHGIGEPGVLTHTADRQQECQSGHAGNDPYAIVTSLTH